MRQELGKYLLDLSKIIFATAFLGTVLSEDVNKILIVGASLVFVISLAIIGLILIKKN